LIDAINERCTWAGIATLSSPVVGDQWVTAAKIGEIQSKIEDLVPYFTNPSGTTSSGSVSFSKYTFATLTASLGMTPDWYRWIDGSLLKGGAAVGDNSAAIGVGASYHFLTQFYLFLDALRWDAASGVTFNNGINEFKQIKSQDHEGTVTGYAEFAGSPLQNLNLNVVNDTAATFSTMQTIVQRTQNGEVARVANCINGQKATGSPDGVEYATLKLNPQLQNLPTGYSKKGVKFYYWHILETELFNNPVGLTPDSEAVVYDQIVSEEISVTPFSSGSLRLGFQEVAPNLTTSPGTDQTVREDEFKGMIIGPANQAVFAIEINFDKLT